MSSSQSDDCGESFRPWDLPHTQSEWLSVSHSIIPIKMDVNPVDNVVNFNVQGIGPLWGIER